MPDYTLGALLRDCWRARYALLGCALVMLALASVWCTLVTPRYAVSMTVGPSDKASARNVTNVAEMSKLSAVQYVARQAGLLRERDDYARYTAILTGPRVATHLHEQNPEQARQLVRDATWPWQGADEEVTPARVSAALDTLITSRRTGRGEMRKVSMQHRDPGFAKNVLETLHESADTILRERSGGKVDQRINYLKKQLATTQNPDHRNVLASLLMRQERAGMMISMDQAYAASVVSPPAATPSPVWPMPVIIVPVAVLIGIVMGYLGYMLYIVTTSPDRDPAAPSRQYSHLSGQ